MNKRVQYISFILMLSFLFSFLSPFVVRKTVNVSFAAETDSSKVLTVFTEPELPSIGETALTDSGLGLDILVSPAEASGYNVYWKSSNTDIATVDEHGHVHGMLTGAYKNADEASCTITCTVSLGGKTSSDSVKVKVKRGHDPLSIQITSSLAVNVGETAWITCHLGEDSRLKTREEVYYISSDPSIAYVDEYGEVTGMSNGSAKVTAYTLNGMSASCNVKVSGSLSESFDTDPADSSALSANELLICYDSAVSNKDIRDAIEEHDASSEAITRTNEDEKIVLTSCSEDTDIEGLLNEVESDDSFRYVQPNFRYELHDTDPYYKDVDLTSISPYSAWNQYFHFQSGFCDAWKLLEANGIAATTTVGVIDSGVDATHNDLKTNLILNGGKYISFRKGVKKSETNDVVSNRHGTHVTGIIGAVYGNGIGGAGGASGVNNNYSKVLTVGAVSDGAPLSYDIIKAIDYAVDQGAKVINMSFGGPMRDRLLGTAIQNHYYNDGVVFVSSAGNEKEDYHTLTYDSSYPSDMKEVISVCNIDRDSSKNKTRTNYGFAKDISAPGYMIYSTGNAPEGMRSLSGTSMSAPVVSAACALILDAYPDLKPWEVRNMICGTANDTSDYLKANELGYGELDSCQAVKAAYKAKEGSSPKELLVKIKEPYTGSVITRETTTTVKATVTKPGMIRKKRLSKAFLFSYRKSTATVKTNTKVVTKNKYTGKTTIERNDTVTNKTGAGISYQIGLRKKGGTWRYYKFTTANRSRTRYKVTVKGNRVIVKFRNLKKRTLYYVRVRAYKKKAGKTFYSAWTAKRRIKTR